MRSLAKRGSVFLVAAVVSALVGVIVTFVTLRSSVTEENDVQKQYDAVQQPFVASAATERSEPKNWVVLLDRELTDQETQELTSMDVMDSSSVFSYLLGLGGRPLAYAPFLENAPPEYYEQHGAENLELADVVKMSFLSTRANPVMIQDWEVVDATCAPSPAKTVVSFPPQGNGGYQGVRVHNPPKADEPTMVDATEGQGEPYFRNHYIEVGGGQSSGALRVEAIAPRGQQCEWGIAVRYVDAYDKERRVELKDSEGKPLRIRTESVAATPRQKWVFGAVPWTPCHLNPRADLCELS